MKRISLVLLVAFMLSSVSAYSVSFSEDSIAEIEKVDVSLRMGAEKIEIIEMVDYDDSGDYADPQFELMDDNEPFYKDYLGYTKMLELDKENSTNFAMAYEIIYAGLTKKQKEITLNVFNLSKADLKIVYLTCLYDMPQLYYVQTSYVFYTNSITKLVSKVVPSYVDQHDDSVFLKKADEIIKASGVHKDMSEFDKALMLHNELIMRVSYNHDAYDAYLELDTETDSAKYTEKKAELDARYPNIHNAYGAIVESSAVCDGYAKSYQYLLQKVGIVSYVVTGPGHAWNIVKIDDKWYYTDVTWDDPDEPGRVYYSYFNMTESFSEKTGHFVDSMFDMPECTETSNNFFVKNNLLFDELDAAKLSNQLKNGITVRAMVTGNTDEARVWLSSGGIKNIVSLAGINYKSCNWSINDKSGEIYIIFLMEQLQLDRNLHLQIGSLSDKTVRVFQAFFDEEGKFLQGSVSNDIELKSGKIKAMKLKVNAIPEKYKSVKVFVWSEGTGLSPLYKDLMAEY